MKKIYIIIVLLVLMALIFYIFLDINNKNDQLDININEKILLNTSVIKGGIINNETEIKYLYSFNDDTITVNDINSDFKPYNNKKPQSNIKIENGNLFINEKKEFSCNVSSCKSYFDTSWRYVIFIDRVLYKEFLFKKLLAFNSIRVFDLKKMKYKDFPILEYKWEKLNIQWISWYIN